MRKPLLLILQLLLFLPGISQTGENFFVTVSYNVENLFDTFDDPGFEDEEFTPEGNMFWTTERYAKKLEEISRVLISLPVKDMPALVGLCEVENRRVLEDLVATRGLRRTGYEIIHIEGADPRGIECALLYRRDLFRVESHETIPVEDPLNPEYLYRGILHVKGTGPDGSNLHVFVNHWKSRSGGIRETEKQRMYTAISLRKKLDLLLAREPDLKVIIMGDFNDEPTDRSIVNGLSASGKRRNIQMGDHYNLYYDRHNLSGEGSYYYHAEGKWNMLDQVIVSYNLLNQEQGLSTSFEGGAILRGEGMLRESDQPGLMVPASTYRGKDYLGGPSDHLPVYVVFTY